MNQVEVHARSNGLAARGTSQTLLIKKFGGTSVANIDRIRRVARLTLESQRAGNDVVVVVSAMSGETDRLLALAHQVLPLPDLRELDVLVATGEQVSVALTAMAIQAEGGQAYSLLGYQLPMLTDSAYTRARLRTVGQGPIERALSCGQIPVIAGFQGVDTSQNITTLGRGGSDTTAVALAAALGANACEIYTDVTGVFTADPRVCPSGRKLSSVAYEEMLELASMGAKVLQVRSVEIAMKHRVPLHVRSSFTDEEGTWVTDCEQELEARALTGLSCSSSEVRVEILGVNDSQDLSVQLTGLLADLNLCVDMLCHTRGATNSVHGDIAFTLPEGDLRRVRQRLEKLAASVGASEMRVSGGLAKVSLIGIGIRSDPEIVAELCRSLARQGISVLGLAVTELRISCLIEQRWADQAVRALHEAFDLSGEITSSATHDGRATFNEASGFSQ